MLNKYKEHVHLKYKIKYNYVIFNTYAKKESIS